MTRDRTRGLLIRSIQLYQRAKIHPLTQLGSGGCYKFVLNCNKIIFAQFFHLKTHFTSMTIYPTTLPNYNMYVTTMSQKVVRCQVGCIKTLSSLPTKSSREDICSHYVSPSAIGASIVV